ncbi:MAG: EcsC family protein, partial [bacterium]
MSKKNEDLTITKEQLKSVLDQCYNKALDGIPQVSDPIERLCEHYLSKHQTVEKAAKGLIARQKLKCAASGFLAGIGGFFTLPVALPANLASVFYVQLRMIAALAMLGGLDPRDEQVHTLCYLCLT